MIPANRVTWFQLPANDEERAWGFYGRETVKELKRMTKKYIHRYNWNRGHQSLNDQTPASVYYANDELQEVAI